MKYLIFFILNLPVMATSFAQQTLPLYPSAIPNSKHSPNEEITETNDGILIVSKISIPTLTVFLPAKQKANGTAIVICPGGGYGVNGESENLNS